MLSSSSDSFGFSTTRSASGFIPTARPFALGAHLAGPLGEPCHAFMPCYPRAVLGRIDFSIGQLADDIDGQMPSNGLQRLKIPFNLIAILTIHLSPRSQKTTPRFMPTAAYSCTAEQRFSHIHGAAVESAPRVALGRHGKDGSVCKRRSSLNWPFRQLNAFSGAETCSKSWGAYSIVQPFIRLTCAPMPKTKQ